MLTQMSELSSLVTLMHLRGIMCYFYCILQQGAIPCFKSILYYIEQSGWIRTFTWVVLNTRICTFTAVKHVWTGSSSALKSHN